MDKFMGRPKKQKVAATVEENEMDLGLLGESLGELEKEGIVATNVATLAQLIQQQKVLTEQIVALRKQDF